jgi:hypothetical protein
VVLLGKGRPALVARQRLVRLHHVPAGHQRGPHYQHPILTGVGGGQVSHGADDAGSGERLARLLERPDEILSARHRRLSDGDGQPVQLKPESMLEDATRGGVVDGQESGGRPVRLREIGQPKPRRVGQDHDAPVRDREHHPGPQRQDVRVLGEGQQRRAAGRRPAGLRTRHDRVSRVAGREDAEGWHGHRLGAQQTHHPAIGVGLGDLGVAHAVRLHDRLERPRRRGERRDRLERCCRPRGQVASRREAPERRQVGREGNRIVGSVLVQAGEHRRG